MKSESCGPERSFSRREATAEAGPVLNEGLRSQARARGRCRPAAGGGLTGRSIRSRFQASKQSTPTRQVMTRAPAVV